MSTNTRHIVSWIVGEPRTYCGKGPHLGGRQGGVLCLTCHRSLRRRRRWEMAQLLRDLGPAA